MSISLLKSLTNSILSRKAFDKVIIAPRAILSLERFGNSQKKDRTSRLSLEEKRQCIEAEHPKLSIKRQCELIELSRASYYRGTPVGGETAENLELMRLIDEEYTRHPFYGSRKMRDWLERQGHAVNRKRVRRLMRKRQGCFR
jgi:hypothetical protein